jgi:hypothetical protein
MRFPFISLASQSGKGTFMPFLPIILSSQNQQVVTHGLVDSGATINVLPYSVGLSLGAVWEQNSMPLRLSGNLAGFEARVLLLNVLVEGCKTVELAFACAKTDSVPVLLGQTNFFMEFDVFFSRSELFFDVIEKK